MKAFDEGYKKEYGREPDPVLAFVYDGILFAVNAVRTYGGDPEVLRKNFKSVKFSGITGEVKFGNLGNRIVD
jgi:ABC-type branched-subunit amino acid transport system substrate-binding protein